jgi:alginate O-acetyltransferase complex protein AlgI
MLFCTWQFCAFFTIVFIVYWSLPWRLARVYLLLGASLFFYAAWNKWLALVLVVSSLVDYLLAVGIDAWPERPRLRWLLVILSVVANLGLLCYFKYANFFLRSIEESAQLLALTASLPVLNVLLPVGISFYTFEAINYTVDVYRRKIRAERNPANFLLFILFFPHLMAGPIVRARDFLPQICRRKRWSWERAHTGALLIVLGVVKKLAVADRMPQYIDPVFADPGAFGTSTLWAAAIGYALQVYCDFSGYSDMAMGLAHLLGYHLARNFDLPFLSANMAEFWRHWHISLSTWIRDYLFIPLGGSRGSRWQTIRNVLITMTLCGLWHGANWNCVLWGFLTGVVLVVHSLFAAWCQRRPRLKSALQTSAGTALRIAMTFACFCLTMAVFRTLTLRGAQVMVARMLMPTTGRAFTVDAGGLYLTFVVVALCHLAAYRERWRLVWDRLPVPVRGLTVSAAFTLALVLAPNASKAFIYFQF